MLDRYLEFCLFCDNISERERANPQSLIDKARQWEDRFRFVPEYYGLLASLYALVGEYSEAINACAKEMELDDEDRPLHLLKRGCLYFDSHNYPKAAKDFEVALTLAMLRPNTKKELIRLIKQALRNARKNL